MCLSHNQDFWSSGGSCQVVSKKSTKQGNLDFVFPAYFMRGVIDIVVFVCNCFNISFLNKILRDILLRLFI